MFPKQPSITLYDPLAELLGAGDGHFSYCFDDVVKLSGHACPTVASAFLLTMRALELLFIDETPQRGAVRIRVCGSVSDQVNGPISQVFTLLTGAAADNGFHGLAGQFSRHNLLRFDTTQRPDGPFTFERMATGQSVQLRVSLAAFPPSPVIGTLLPRILAGEATSEQRLTFGHAWRQRVMDILNDGGRQTIQQV
ncbi:MAG: hypothetical protein HQL58_11835 [Magnetococcales bacterium]|nr:hypothetical protein [Magnetococcales bacterium]